MIWKVRDQLEANLSKGELKDLLDANGQAVPKGESGVGVHVYYTCSAPPLLYKCSSVSITVYSIAK